jgi:hypothetical protein
MVSLVSLFERVPSPLWRRPPDSISPKGELVVAMKSMISPSFFGSPNRNSLTELVRPLADQMVDLDIQTSSLADEHFALELHVSDLAEGGMCPSLVLGEHLDARRMSESRSASSASTALDGKPSFLAEVADDEVFVETAKLFLHGYGAWSRMDSALRAFLLPLDEGKVSFPTDKGKPSPMVTVKGHMVSSVDEPELDEPMGCTVRMLHRP